MGRRKMKQRQAGVCGLRERQEGKTVQNSFFQAICRVGIFMICAQAIVHFRPNEAYEKYLKMLVGAMVLIQLFLPFGSFLLGTGGQQAAQTLEQFKQEMEQAIKEAEENAAAADALLDQLTLEEVRSRMEEQKEKAQEGNAQPGEGSEGGQGWQGDEAVGNNPVDNALEEAGESAIEIEAVDPIHIGTLSPVE